MGQVVAPIVMGVVLNLSLWVYRFVFILSVVLLNWRHHV